MDRYYRLSPCAASALFGTRQLTIAGKQVGITGLDAACAAVDARGVTSDAEITAELMRRVQQDNYVPPALAAEYGAAVLAEYRKSAGKSYTILNQEEMPDDPVRK
jgi:hypothetical protein